MPRTLQTVLALYPDLQTTRGPLRAAEAYYERALSIRERTEGRTHPAFADTQIGLALALANLGDLERALAAATGGEATAREHLRLTARYLPERLSLSYAASRPKGLDLILSLVGKTPGASDAALDACDQNARDRLGRDGGTPPRQPRVPRCCAVADRTRRREAAPRQSPSCKALANSHRSDTRR